MAVNLTEKFSGKVDEKLKLEALTSNAVNNDYEFVGAKTVKVYNIDTVEMVDYKKTGLNRYGEANELGDSVQELTMSQDKSFTFTIDKINAEESSGARQTGEALARQIRERVIPMIDLYRLNEMAKKAGTKATASNLTKTNVADAILAGTEALDNAEVSIVGRQLFVTPATYKLMKQSADIVLDTEIGQDMKLRGVIALFDGMEIIKVPVSRVPSKFGFLITHPIACCSPVKLADYKIHVDPPGISGSLVEGRVYFDAFVLENKKTAIYYHALA